MGVEPSTHMYKHMHTEFAITMYGNVHQCSHWVGFDSQRAHLASLDLLTTIPSWLPEISLHLRLSKGHVWLPWQWPKGTSAGPKLCPLVNPY